MSIITEKTSITIRDENALHEQLDSIRNLEGITLIWYDPNMNVSIRKKLKLAKNDLRPINNFVIFVKEEESCTNTIKSITNEKILFVTSGSGADRILSFENKSIHKLVHTVFIFCRDKDKYQNLLAKYPKIKAIFTDAEELKKAIKNEVDLIEKHFEAFKFYDESEQNSISALPSGENLYFWLCVFKEIVIRMSKNDKAKNDMIDACTKYYLGNKSELDKIQKFNRTYKSEHAIRWYTQTSFLYRLINKALRIEDVEQLYVFRFYISDLCQAIDNRHKQITEQCSWTFYRGARLPLKEMERLKHSEGKLITINGFLSTSKSKEVAIDFAATKTATDTEESVLFEIECDNESAAFAFIEEGSCFPEEEEVLINLATTFTVLSVTDNRKEEKEEGKQTITWIAKLRNIQDGKKKAQEGVNRLTTISDQRAIKNDEVLWGWLLCEMGEFEKSVKYFRKLMDSRPTGVPVEEIHWQLTNPLWELRRLDDVLEHLELSKKNFHRFGNPWNWYTLSGAVYLEKDLYHLAIQEFQEALVLAQNFMKNLERSNKIFERHQCVIAQLYNSLGTTYYHTRQHELALSNFMKALEIYLAYIPQDYISKAEIYMRVADLHRIRGDCELARNYYEEALRTLNTDHVLHSSVSFKMGLINYQIGLMDRKNCRFQHSFEHVTDALTSIQERNRGIKKCEYNVVECYRALGEIHMVRGEFQSCLESSENALNKALSSYDKNDHRIANLYYIKGIALECLRANDEALTAFKIALDIQRKFNSGEHRDLARSLSSTGNQYRIKKDFSQAKKHCNEALAMQERILPADDPDTCLPFYHIGLILYDEEDYKESLANLRKAREKIKKYVDAITHIHSILILTAIGDVYKRLEKIFRALKYYKEALLYGENFFLSEHPMILDLCSKIKALDETTQGT